VEILTSDINEEELPPDSIIFGCEIWIGSREIPYRFMKEQSETFLIALAKSIGISSKYITITSIKSGLTIEFKVLFNPYNFYPIIDQRNANFDRVWF
jgi:hypothetical protein